MELKEGMYVRTKNGNIGKITFISPLDNLINLDTESYSIGKHFVEKASYNIIDLIEYMDLLILEHPVKLYDSEASIGLFNPVRCDGFTTFEDGTHCIILNMDYIVNVKDLRIKKVLTHEQFESMSYRIGD